MGNSGSLVNCKQCYEPTGYNGCLKTIDVDSDIAGVGVIVAFSLIAFTTCLLVCYAYVTDSLPECLLSDLDCAIILWLRRPMGDRVGFKWIGRFFSFLRLPLPRERRVEAITRILLGFSDQQLVTGLGILIATIANSANVTVYELRIIYNLAYLSAVTHLVTLIALPLYFYEHSPVRNFRAIGIFVFIVLISFVQVVLLLAGDSDDPESGGVNEGRPILCIANGHDRRSSLSFVDFLNETYILWLLITSYVESTYMLFLDPRKLHTHSIWVYKIWTSLHPFNRQLPGKEILLHNVNLQHAVMISPEVLEWSQPKRRHRRLWWNGFSGWNITQYRHSFLMFFSTLTYFLNLGVSEMISIQGKDIKTTNDSRKMGFGQVVPIVLLVVPLLAATEIYDEARQAVDEHTDDKLQELERHRGDTALSLREHSTVNSRKSSTENLRTDQTAEQDSLPSVTPLRSEDTEPCYDDEVLLETLCEALTRLDETEGMHEDRKALIALSLLLYLTEEEELYLTEEEKLYLTEEEKLYLTEEEKLYLAEERANSYPRSTRSYHWYPHSNTGIIMPFLWKLSLLLPLIPFRTVIFYWFDIVASIWGAWGNSIINWVATSLITLNGLWELVIRYDLMQHQLDLLGDAALLDKFEPESDPKSEDTTSTSLDEASIRSGSSRGAATTPHQELEMSELEPIRRQDTEADIGLVHRATHTKE